MATVRSDVEIDGVKSYFFAPLLKNILENEQKLIENEGFSPFADFVLGLTEEFPKPGDVYPILAGTNPQVSQIVAAIDAMSVFGDEYRAISNQLAEVLNGNAVRHDVHSLKNASVNQLAFERDLATLVRKASIGKVQGNHLLNFLQTILIAKTDIERLNAFSSLCLADFDWDAYVFLKLFSKGSPDEIDEMKLIRENIIAKIGGKRGNLVDLWLNGRKVDPAVEFVRNLNKPISETIELVVPQIVENILAVIKKEDDTSLLELAPLTSQLFYLIYRAVVSGAVSSVADIFAKLPSQVRKIMFPGLAEAVLKDSIALLNYFAPCFIEASQRRKSLVGLETDGIFCVLADSWKRDAIVKLFVDFKAAISRDVFGVSLAHGYENGPQHCNFIIELLKSYDGEMHVDWLSYPQRANIANTLKREALISQVAKENIARVIAALEKIEGAPNSPEPKDPTPIIREDPSQIIQEEPVKQIEPLPEISIEIQKEVQVEPEIVAVPEIQIEQDPPTLGQDEVDATTSSSTPSLKSVPFETTEQISEKSVSEESVPEVVAPVQEPIQEPIKTVPVETAPPPAQSIPATTSQFGAGDMPTVPKPTSQFQSGGFGNAPASCFGKMGGFGGGGQSQPVRSFGGPPQRGGGGGGYRGGQGGNRGGYRN
ncbi:unnamed protein product [Caenorhabditis angaria]|uniref:Uncharacterized protein n=1 Tax=Caenorhabditis angaria TaxID=860376 RepID=A0A9P1MXY0_9PELO|nr:unnamed protein product [Caenorhabditis angaria]